MIINTEKFQYHKDERKFTAFISELRRIEHSFLLKSQWTGKLMRATTDRIETDRENDVVAWHYKTENGITVTVWND